MPRIETLTGVPESEVSDLTKEYKDDGADVVATKDATGTFTVVATYPDPESPSVGAAASGKTAPAAGTSGAGPAAPGPTTGGAGTSISPQPAGTQAPGPTTKSGVSTDTLLGRLMASNLQRWQQMSVDASLIPTLAKVAARLIAPSAKSRYQSVATTTKVPWFVIAVIHEREASQSWAANLAQGDPWNTVSTHVPANRGPFASWEEAAVDALTNCRPHAANWQDWTIGGVLTLLERYNGLGYATRGRPSPYIWASTDQYVTGKFVADGHYDPNAVDHQLGCAALLSRMKAADPTITI